MKVERTCGRCNGSGEGAVQGFKCMYCNDGVVVEDVFGGIDPDEGAFVYKYLSVSAQEIFAGIDDFKSHVKNVEFELGNLTPEAIELRDKLTTWIQKAKALDKVPLGEVVGYIAELHIVWPLHSGAKFEAGEWVWPSEDSE